MHVTQLYFIFIHTCLTRLKSATSNCLNRKYNGKKTANKLQHGSKDKSKNKYINARGNSQIAARTKAPQIRRQPPPLGFYPQVN